jgi:hypothetical protein
MTTSLKDIEDLHPCVPDYCPASIKDVKVGDVKKWCTCGLSQKQPWCDGSHIGTPFTPLIWTVPGTLKDNKPQRLYSICMCKYTSSPP